jgi:hypothetical protein
MSGEAANLESKPKIAHRAQAETTRRHRPHWSLGGQNSPFRQSGTVTSTWNGLGTRRPLAVEVEYGIITGDDGGGGKDNGLDCGAFYCATGTSRLGILNSL